MSERITQQQRILARLERGPATSWELGPELGILSLTRRIFELRKRYQITSSEQWKGRTRIVTYKLGGLKHGNCEKSNTCSLAS